MRLAAALVVLTLAAAPAAAEVVVGMAGGQVDLTATAAPLAEVLDRLARQTGMKVVYEGPAPRQLVSLSLHGRTPAETVLALFEGLGINYALLADASGARVQTLVVAGAVAASPSATSSSSGARHTPAVAPTRRPFGPPPGSSPESPDAGFPEAEEEPEPDEADLPGMPPGVEATDPGAQATPDPAAANAPPRANAVPPPGAGLIPTPPPSPFSSSPFTPQPQPFPPVPPGVLPSPPAGTANPAPQEGAPATPPPQ